MRRPRFHQTERRRIDVRIARSAEAVATRRQSVQPRRVGVLIARDEGDPEGQKQASALLRGLDMLGWSRGRNLEVDIRWQNSEPAKRLALAGELIGRNPDVLVVNSTGYVQAAKQLTSTIPIVFVAVADPVAQGFVQSLARPGGPK